MSLAVSTRLLFYLGNSNLSSQVLDYWVFGRIFCDIWAAVDVLCCTASIMSLCVISIDRYIGVRYPLQYPMIVTEKRALLAMLGVWILAIVISIGPLLGWKQPPSQVLINQHQRIPPQMFH